MSVFLLSLASAYFWSKAGYWLLAVGLLGDLAVIFIPARKHLLEKCLAGLFTLTIFAGVVVGHIGDNAILVAVEKRAVKAEQKLADRSLSDEQIAQIGARLIQFAGQRFTMNTYWNDREPNSFTKRIGEDALITHAHWQFVRPNGFLVGIIGGLTVDVANDADEKTKTAASALVSALKDEDVVATLSHDQTDATLISITVGTKP